MLALMPTRAGFLSKSEMMNLETVKRNYRQLRSDLKGVFSLVRAVPEFFSEQITLQRAEKEIKRDLDHREQTFLDLVRAPDLWTPKQSLPPTA